METPTSLYDKKLLRAEPFVTRFHAFSLDRLEHPRQSRSENKKTDAFFHDVASDVQKDPASWRAAASWLKLAFKPHKLETQNVKKVNPKDIQSLVVFVRFFYELHLGGRQCQWTAETFLFTERKNRGHGYNVPRQISTNGESSPSSEPQLAPKKKRGRKPRVRESESTHSAPLQAIIPPSPVVDESDMVSSPSSSSLASEEIETLQFDPIPSRVGGLLVEEGPENSLLDAGSSTAPIKKRKKGGRKAKQAQLTIDTSVAPVVATPPPQAPTSTQPVSPGLSDLSDLTSLGSPTSPLFPNNPAAMPDEIPQADHSPNPETTLTRLPLTRRLPGRAASRADRLSAIMRNETQYHVQRRKGQEPTPEINNGVVSAPVPIVAPISRRQPPPRKRKRVDPMEMQVVEAEGGTQSVNRLTVDSAGGSVEAASMDIEPPVEAVLPCDGTAKGRPDLPKTSSPLASSSVPRRKSNGRKKKTPAPKPAGDLPLPPPKRRRSNHSTAEPVALPVDHVRPLPPEGIPSVTSAGPAVPQRSLGPPAPQDAPETPHVGADSVSARVARSRKMKEMGRRVSAPAPPQTRAAPKKRSRPQSRVEIVEPFIEQHVTHRDSSRETRPLPAHKQQRVTLRVRAPAPPITTSINAPMTQVDVDNLISAAATEASALLSNTDVIHDDWVEAAANPAINTREGDDDDDDDVPIRDVVARLKRLITSSGRNTPTAFSRSPTLVSPSRLQMPITSGPETPPFPKRLLPSNPPIWAQSRQEVCESFDWFRSYQGGVYFTKDIVKGYLLGGFSACRDIFRRGGRLIVSHGGGKAESIHTNHGQHETHLASDQLADDKSVRALLKTYEMKKPLVVIVDDKYALFPFDLAEKGCTYAILGWYRIAYAWAERQPSPEGCVVRYKFAFQWCEEQGQPWWVSMDPSLDQVPSPSSFAPGLHPGEVITLGPPSSESMMKQCNACHKRSPQVYAERWSCLDPACSHFWSVDEGDTAPDSLTYSPSFLELVPFVTQELADLRPSPPPRILPQTGEVGTSRHHSKGWHCRNCGRLSSRYKWEHWECRSCGATFGTSGRVRTAQEFRHQASGTNFLKHRHSTQAGVVMKMSEMYRCDKSFGQFVTFVLPHDRGRVHVIYSSPLGNGDADAILQKYQTQAASGQLKFRRWPLRAHKCRGALLSNYFSQNTGKPYQYVGGAENTVPFEPESAVTDALKLIQRRMEQALKFKGNFNEVLSAAYMEKQKMAYHSDSERGLGPVVASLSLGASAYMHFRLHNQYTSELEEGCSREVLSLFLRHGDVVVMQGDGVQKYYEHTVVPLNFRVAATARFIGNTHY